jgi:hypothetical protein
MHLQHFFEHVQIYKLTFNCQLVENAVFDAYKGSAFHGGFGNALMKYDESLYRSVFEGKQFEGQVLKAFTIVPPNNEKTHWQAGEYFSFELTLIHQSEDILHSILSACFLWQDLGVGKKLSPFAIVSIDSQLANGKKWTIYQHSCPALLFNNAASLSELIDAQQLNFDNPTIDVADGFIISIRANTRLHIKHHGAILQSAPEPQIFINAIYRRLKQVMQLGGGESAIEELYQTMPNPENFGLTNNHAYFLPWMRYSKREGRKVPMGGLLGQWCYNGDVLAILPLLALGEWLGIGNKTSFGFGQYSYNLGLYQPLL